ncbi:MAG: WecB/TagA/CpsF family glycosyltransferase [Solirubrobacteraceae bacterium]|nr:WecB/TagA/CpsF family glycosyltransferase [Solirubrobacteraceae bacterium]
MLQPAPTPPSTSLETPEALTPVIAVETFVPDRIDLLGLAIDRVTEREAIDRIMGTLDAGRGGWVITPNAAHLREFCRSEELRELMGRADLSVADGMPLVWASRLQQTPLPERVAGSNLIYSLSEEAARRGATIFLLGGDEGVAEHAAVRLQEHCPGLLVAGTHYPPMGFERDAIEMNRIRAALLAAQPDIVYVGLGFPKQERLIDELRDLLPETWFLGIGISLSFVSGDASRAPQWMHDSGLEWLHRLIDDPPRLWRRYVKDGLPFVFGMLVRCAWRGRGERRAARRLARHPVA